MAVLLSMLCPAANSMDAVELKSTISLLSLTMSMHNPQIEGISEAIIKGMDVLVED